MSLLWRGTYFTLGYVEDGLIPFELGNTRAKRKAMKHKIMLFFHFFFKKGKHWEKRLFRHYFVACFGYVFLASSLSNQFAYDYENKHEKTAQVWNILN